LKKYEIEADKIAEICSGKIYGNKKILIENYSNDTRKIKLNDMYIAIKGDKIDGNNFIEEALEKGAIGCITDKEIDGNILQKYTNKVFIKVDDVIKAIQKIALYKRNLYDIPVIAVTGSVGKTSTKDIIASVLSQKYDVLKTEGNFNNHIGLPLTLLKLKNQTAVVVEMGMNHLGEISKLTNIAKPTICVITNIGTAHIGNLGSRENILKAKLEILEGLKPNGFVVINNDNDLLNKWKEQNKKYNVYTYGINNSSKYMAVNILENENQSSFNINKTNIKILVGGEHFIYNALCAFTIGKILNIQENVIADGIKKFKLTEKRMEIQKIKNNITVVNDSYNASLDSMRATLNVINKMKANRKIAVLGNMLELGDFSEKLHREVGKVVVQNNINILVTVGEYAKYIADEAKKLNMQNIFVCKNIKEAAKILNENMKENDLILLKASNSMNFSKILNLIK
jgi:UDP-N-acetylmuramoyl-tripeptide--D-alanyl-D-alanine ligase